LNVQLHGESTGPMVVEYSTAETVGRPIVV
jgi:hypothetical protein